LLAPELLTVGGLKVAVAPAGKPDAVRLTTPLKPALPFTRTVIPALPPGATLWEGGEAVTGKGAPDPAWT